MRTVRRSALTLGLLVALAAPALAQEPEGLGVRELQHFNLETSPFSGPVEVLANSNHPTVARGTFTDAFIVVQNHSNEVTVSVVIELELRYADGEAVRPFHLGVDRVQTLGPDQGVGFFIFWAIPPDAPLGEGSLRISARVGRLSGGDEGHDDNTNPMIASDAVSFEVVP